MRFVMSVLLESHRTHNQNGGLRLQNNAKKYE